MGLGNTYSSYDDFSDSQKNNINIIVIVTTTLSIAGALFILVSYAVFIYVNWRRKKKILAQLSAKSVNEASLIVSMTLSDLVQHVNQLVGSARSYKTHGAWIDQDPMGCKAQAFVEQLFPLATSLWALCIAVTMYRLIVLKTNSQSLYKYFHAFCWGVPLILAVVGLSSGMYGRAGNWCWIKERGDQVNMQYVEMITIFLLICAIYIRVLIYVRRHSGVGSAGMRVRQRHAVMRIAWFPLVFLISWSGGLVNRLNAWISGSESYPLNVYMYFTIPSMGWLNAIAYGFSNDNIRQMYRDAYRTTIGRQPLSDSLDGPLDACLLPPNMKAALAMHNGEDVEQQRPVSPLSPSEVEALAASGSGPVHWSALSLSDEDYPMDSCSDWPGMPRHNHHIDTHIRSPRRDPYRPVGYDDAGRPVGYIDAGSGSGDPSLEDHRIRSPEGMARALNADEGLDRRSGSEGEYPRLAASKTEDIGGALLPPFRYE